MLVVLALLISLACSRDCYSGSNQAPLNYNHELINGTDCMPCYYRCMQCNTTLATGCNVNSCERGYFYTSTGRCDKCPPNCHSCANANECLSCFAGYYLTAAICLACPAGVDSCSISAIVSCLPGYFYEASRLQCSACISNCRSCQNLQSCVSCLPGFYYQSSNSSCVACTSNCTVCGSSTTCSDCQPGYTIVADGSCQLSNCTAVNCLECSVSASQCTLCHQGFYNRNNQCIAGSSLLCGLARGPDFGGCLNCSNYSSQPKDTVSYCIVPPTDLSVSYVYLTAMNNPEYFGSTTTTSKYCDHILTTPQSSYTITAQFPPSYQVELVIQLVHFISGSNFTFTVSLQPSNTPATETEAFWDLQQSTPTTEVCNNKSKFFMRSHAVLQVRGAYSQIKVVGSQQFSIAELLLKYSLCQTANCSVCSASKRCLSCVTPLLLLRGACVESCESGYYTDVVHRNCVYACPSGLYLDPPTYQCLQCVAPCGTCAAVNVCLSCVNTSTSNAMFLDGSSCVKSCNSNTTYGNPLTGKCESCLNPCITCMTLGSNCTSCSAGYLLLGDQSGSCLTECPSGTYGRITASMASCEICSTTCATCSFNSSFCTSCPAGKYLYVNSCVNGCPNGYYANQQQWQCVACLQPCATCTSVGWNCSSCTMGVLVSTVTNSTTTNKCESICPIGKYSSASMLCVTCPVGCLQCSNATYCLSCTNVTTGTSTTIYYLESNLCRTVCSTGFMDNTTNMCSSCIYPCHLCQQDYIGNVCLSCRAGFFLQEHSCVPVCSVGYYRSNDTCLSCLATCRTCTNGTGCTSCQLLTATSVDLASSTLLFVFRNGQCLNKSGCVSAEYLNKNITTGTYYCSKCDASCLTCSQYSTNCLSCNSQFLLFGNQCVSKCGLGYFNSSNTCASCSVECRQCTGNTSSNCQACNPPYFLLSNACLSKCPNGYFGNSVLNTCDLCPIGCQTCTSGYSCMSCSAVSSQKYYFLNNRCLQSCPTGTIANTTPVAQCKLCSTGCATCNTFVDNCTACTSGLFLQSSTNTTKTCLQSCQDKLYADSSTMSCLPCRSPCLTCSTLSLCQSCINVTGSQEQTYYYQQSCLLTCPDMTFPNTTSLVCQNCSYPCKTCTATNCLSCISGLYMSNSHCVSNCIDGYYGDSSVGSCIACIPPCQFCSASTVCTSCQPGYSLKNGVCLNNCPKGTFTNNLTRQCSNCSANCQRCLLTASNCVSCNPPLMLNSVNQSCTTVCPGGYYSKLNSNLRLECQNCSSLCDNCSDFTKCTSCRAPLMLQNSQCLVNCSPHYYASDGVCLSCSIDCASCTNQGTCYSCTSMFLSNGSCVADCPKGLYKDYSRQACTPCSANCLECPTSNNCTRCLDGYAVLSGFCVKLPCRYPYYSRPESSSCLLQCQPADFQTNRTCYSKCPPWLVANTDSKQCVQDCQSNEFINPRLECQQCTDQTCSQKAFNFSVIYIPKSYEISVLVVFSKPYQSGNGFCVTLLNGQAASSRRMLTASVNDGSMVLSLTFNPGVSLRNSQLVVSAGTYNSGYLDQSGNILQNYQSTLDIGSYDFYGKQGTPAFAFVLMLIVVLFACTLVYLQQQQLVWDAFDYCQILFFACLIPVQLPPSLDQFLTALSVINIRFDVSNYPAINSSPYKYYQYTTDINFLRNVACDIIVVLAVGLIVGIACLLLRFKDKVRFNRLISFAESVWSNKYIIALEVYLLTSLNAGLFSFAQLYDTNIKSNGFLGFNMFATSLGIVVTLSVPIGICGWLYYQLQQKVKDVNPQHCFFRDLDMTKAEMGLMFNGFRVIRRVLWVVLLGLYPQNQVYGLSSMLLTSATLISVLVMYRPYLDELRNNLMIAQQAILLGVYCTLLLLVLNKGDNINGKLALGAIVQIECIALVLLSLVNPGLTVYRLMKAKLQRTELQEGQQKPQPNDLNDVAAQQPADNHTNKSILPQVVLPTIIAPHPTEYHHERMSSDGSMMEESSGNIRSRKFKLYQPSESQFPRSD